MLTVVDVYSVPSSAALIGWLLADQLLVSMIEMIASGSANHIAASVVLTTGLKIFSSTLSFAVANRYLN